MKIFRFILCIIFYYLIKSAEAVPKIVVNDIGIRVAKTITNFGYPVEIHNVVTEDGYILTTFRIPNGKNQDVENGNRTKEVVLLVHGMLMSSYVFVCLGPKSSLPFLLADSGYDVWLINARGSLISKSHVHLDPEKDEKYWHFSWHEIGVHDIPANMDYIMEKTGKTEMVIIGNSQGTTSMFVMTSDRPEYNKHVKLGIALGPSVYLGHSNSGTLQALLRFYRLFKFASAALSFNDIFPNAIVPGIETVIKPMCIKENFLQDLCIRLILLPVSTHPDVKAYKTLVPSFLKYGVTGISMFQLLHYAQIAKHNRFEHYDYGTLKNIQKYGKIRPPIYKLSNSKAPILLMYSAADVFANEQDIQRLGRELPDASLYKFSEDINHYDYVMLPNVEEIVNKRILHFISLAYNNTYNHN